MLGAPALDGLVPLQCNFWYGLASNNNEWDTRAVFMQPAFCTPAVSSCARRRTHSPCTIHSSDRWMHGTFNGLRDSTKVVHAPQLCTSIALVVLATGESGHVGPCMTLARRQLRSSRKVSPLLL